MRECVQDQLDTIGDAQLIVNPQQRFLDRVLFYAEFASAMRSFGKFVLYFVVLIKRIGELRD